MPPDLCLLCRNISCENFNLVYESSVRHQVIELCGEQIRVHLREHQVLCGICMGKIRFAVELRRILCRRVLMDSQKVSTNGIGNNDLLVNGLGYGGDPCASGTDEDDGDDYDNSFLSPTSYNSIRPSTPFRRSCTPNNMVTSPNNLLMVKHSFPFDQRPESDMDEASRKYHERDTPNLDKEVQRANYRGRKRRRGKSHNWTRRKGSQRSRCQSRFSGTTRSTSRMSRISRSVTSSQKKNVIRNAKTEQTARILSDFLNENNDSLSHFAHVFLSNRGAVIGEGKLNKRYLGSAVSTPHMKTRYASELRGTLIAQYQDYVFECPDDSCKESFLSLEEITRHRIKQHEKMALYWCEQCKFNYLTKEYLDKHILQCHQHLLSFCIYCGEWFTNKQLYEIHSNEHLEFSIACAYCDKSFLSQNLCRSHMRAQHSGQHKFKKNKPQAILDRIDKEQVSENSTNLVNKLGYFEVRTLHQSGSTDESSVSVEDCLSADAFNCSADIINTNNETTEEQAIESEDNVTEISEPITDS